MHQQSLSKRCTSRPFLIDARAEPIRLDAQQRVYSIHQLALSIRCTGSLSIRCASIPFPFGASQTISADRLQNRGKNQTVGLSAFRITSQAAAVGQTTCAGSNSSCQTGSHALHVRQNCFMSDTYSGRCTVLHVIRIVSTGRTAACDIGSALCQTRCPQIRRPVLDVRQQCFLSDKYYLVTAKKRFMPDKNASCQPGGWTSKQLVRNTIETGTSCWRRTIGQLSWCR